MNTDNLGKIVIYDIETLYDCFLYMDKLPGEDIWNIYTVNLYENQLDGMVKYLVEADIDYMVQFNGNRFDWQVLQHILDNHDKWYDLTNREVLDKIYQFAQGLISNQDYEILPPYREDQFDRKQIDLFSILGYENKNKRTSLKYIEFSLDMEVDEMPIDHWQKGLSVEDIGMIKEYCKNDIKATEELYKLVRGNTENSLYKGEDSIADRLTIMEEMKLKPSAINWSDVNMGEEMNLIGYMKEAGISNRGKLYEMKKGAMRKKSWTFGDCIPSYVKFQTEEFQKFHEMVKKQQFSHHGDQEYIFKYNNTTYSIMRGGIHSHDPARIMQTTAGIIIRTADIGSQYPNSINKRFLFPCHMGPKWNVNYKKNTQKRNHEYKPLAKKDKKYKGLAKMYKLALNGGGFGKLNDTYSVQYDPYPHFQCTIGNQFEILMLIEMLELANIPVYSANTDGITCMFPEELSDKYYQMCNEWESIVGNDTDGKLEYQDVKKIVQTSVNDYIEIAIDDTVKLKGDFCYDVEIHKNKSKRVIPLALYAYYVEGKSPDEYIRNHNRIWDFLIAKKSSKDYYYESINRRTGEVKKLNKLVRYYCAKDYVDGGKLWKMKHEHSEKTGPKKSQCQTGSDQQVMFNKPFMLHNIKDYKIDYEWYISECYKLINAIEPEVGRDRKEKAAGLQTLF